MIPATFLTLDNSSDAGSTEVIIDVIQSDPVQLVVQDNGHGMSSDALHAMLSFGHCMKQGDNNIGRYGNGFKSGSMRIGKDVLVLTKDGLTMSAGFLSRTFLDSVAAAEVLIPLVSSNFF
jgi:hypothetical protein